MSFCGLEARRGRRARQRSGVLARLDVEDRDVDVDHGSAILRRGRIVPGSSVIAG